LATYFYKTDERIALKRTSSGVVKLNADLFTPQICIRKLKMKDHSLLSVTKADVPPRMVW